jgi:hypothetical protein
MAGPRGLARWLVGAGGAVAAVTVHGWVGYVALGVAALLLGRRALARAPMVVPATVAVVVMTALVHAAFFGAGRYGMAVAPFVAALAFASSPRTAPGPVA